MSATCNVVTSIREPDIVRHLEALPAEDVWRRFGNLVRSAGLRAYAQGIDLAVGVFDSASTLVGFAHVAVDHARGTAEIGISVLPGHRRQGIGEAMLLDAVKLAASRGLATVRVCISPENGPALSLAAKAGFVVASWSDQMLIAVKQIAGVLRS